jgi:predicted AlkP superfamily pyrophosphatase or phosphodiesterase
VTGGPSWLPGVVEDAAQVVLLVIDGLGWEQLADHRAEAPTIASMAGGPITSVVPTTTATALTSLTTGLAPGIHGVVGYRVAVAGAGPATGPGGGGRGDPAAVDARGSDGAARGRFQVLNVLKWTTGAGDARALVPPSSFQPHPSFLGRCCPVVSRVEFAGTGFSDAHLAGSPLAGWRVASSLAVEVRRLLAAGEPFVYAYYDGVDKVAHEKGLGEHYAAELRYADRLVGDLLEALVPGAVLVVTADHGQVEVRRPPVALDPAILADVHLLSGEGRFRWLHVAPGATDRVRARCEERYGDLAWVRTRAELVEQGWFGPALAPGVAERLGDVALVARQAVAFFDPADTGEMHLVSRHGSLTSAEMYVPLVAASR